MKRLLILLITVIVFALPSLKARAIPIGQKGSYSVKRKKRRRTLTYSAPKTYNYDPDRQSQSSRPVFSRTLTHLVQPPKDLDPSLNCYIWEDIAPIPFDELIISWNAKRPESGHITFWTSVQYGSQWSPWHRMSTWGAGKQRSFVNKVHQHVHTKHVRVELQRKQSACAFKVKAVFHDGASIENLHALFACCTYQQYFKATNPYCQYPKLFENSNAIVIPQISQMQVDHHRYQDLCAPTSLSMVTSHFNRQFLSDHPKHDRDLYNYTINFANRVHDYGIDIYGNWQLNAAQAYDACEGTVFFRVERFNSFDDIYALLKHKVPVIVSVRRLKGGATPYAQGHILVVVGWNPVNRTVICHDPAFKGKEINKEYPLRDFSRAWALSKNFAYVALPKNLMEEFGDKFMA